MDKLSTRSRRISVQTVTEPGRVRGEEPAREPGLSLREAIRRLAPRLQTLRSKGYTSEGIIDLLLHHGMGSSRSTLRSYLREFAPRPLADLRPEKGRTTVDSLLQRAQAADAGGAVVHHARTVQ